MLLVDDVRRDVVIEQYHLATSGLFASLMEDEGVTAMGLFGEFSTPGISDVDAVIVARREHLKPISEKAQVWIAGNPQAQYLFTHPPLFITEDQLRSAGRLHTLYNVRWHHQRKSVEVQPPSEEASMLLEFSWVSFLLPALANTMLSGQASLRGTLLILKNLHQSCENLSKHTGAPRSYKHLSSHIRSQVLASDPHDPHVMQAVVAAYEVAMQDTMTLLDAACRKLLSDFAPRSVRRWVPLSRHLAVVSSPDTTITRRGSLAIVQANEHLCAVLLSEARGNHPLARSVNAYHQALREVFQDYQGLGLPMPFISPFGLDPRHFSPDLRYAARALALRGVHLASKSLGAVLRRDTRRFPAPASERSPCPDGPPYETTTP